MWDKRLQISSRELDRSFVELSTDISTPKGDKLFKELAKAVKTVTRYNCSCFISYLVASGSTEARVVTNGKGGPWDYAPGALLTVEAGGVVTHFDGSEYDYMNTENIIMGTKAVQEFVLGLKLDED